MQPPQPKTASTREDLLTPLMNDQERVRHWRQHRPHDLPTPQPEDPYRRIGIIGGGTAGFLTALALRARFPHLDVTLIESSAIPIIGVGEATAPHIVPFLHQFCGIDVHEFYEQVRPTWKLGIRFDWGPKEISHFNAPFDWEYNNVGVLGSLAYDGNTNAMTIESILMDHQATPIVDRGGLVSLLRDIPYAYHLENRRLVKYLHKIAASRGITHLDRKIADVVVTEDGQEIDHLLSDQGERLSFDLYIDCTGFRSLLLGKALKTPFVSYASTLFTDRALTFSTPHDGKIKPYTTATTMNSGWTWTIPHEEHDNNGYVFSSAFCTPEEAEREARARWPRMGDVNDVVHFRSGRHQDCWRGNVVAVGNAHAFVEPLESTGLFMICVTIQKLLALFPESKRDQSSKILLNQFVSSRWDGLRWFLGGHFKFNTRKDTPFWQAARAKVDISGAEYLLQTFRERGPLRARSNEVLQIIKDAANTSIFFGVDGWDCILLGQAVQSRLYECSEPREAWQARKQWALDLAAQAVDHAQALQIVRQRPEFLDELTAKDAWPRQMFPAAAIS